MDTRGQAPLGLDSLGLDKIGSVGMHCACCKQTLSELWPETRQNYEIT